MNPLPLFSHQKLIGGGGDFFYFSFLAHEGAKNLQIHIRIPYLNAIPYTFA